MRLGATILAVGWVVVGATRVAAAPRFDYRGHALPARQAATLMARSLAAPRDSLALSLALGDLIAHLEGLGYLDARATAGWDSTGGQSLWLVAREGRRYRLSALELRTPSAADSAALAEALPPLVGDWASPLSVRRALERALDTVVGSGHPYAALGIRSWEPDSEGVRVELSGGLGPLVTITRVRLEGRRVTQQKLAEKSMGRLSGLPYNPAAALAARARLQSLGVFRSVAYQGLEGESDWSRGQLVYKVEEPRYNRFEGALGLQGESGPVGLVHLDLDNLAGTGRSIGFRWDARGRGAAQFGARYAEPLLFGAPLRLEAAFDQQLQDTLFVRTRIGGRARYAFAGRERVEAGFEEERVVQNKVAATHADLQSTVFALERDARDAPSAPRSGARLRVEAVQTAKTVGTSAGRHATRSSAVELEAEWHRPLGARFGLAIEARGAGRLGAVPVLELYERYPLGGATSLRGYDEEQFRVDRYALGRFEWRWFLGGNGERLALFWDHAHAETRQRGVDGVVERHAFDRDGVGFGLRVASRSGALGLDYGLRPGRPPLEGKIHITLVSAF